MPQGLTIEQVIEHEQVCRATVFNRVNAGELRRLPDSSIDLGSLSLEGQQRWKEAQLAKARSAPPSGPPQGDLYWSPEIAALSIPSSQKDIVQKRADLCRAALNGKWRELGFARKRDFVYDLAEKADVGGRTLERWIAKLKPTVTPECKTGDLRLLLDRAPGPHPGGGGSVALEPWARQQVENEYCRRKFTIQQCYESVCAEIGRRQNAWGLRDLYPVPSYSAVRRFVADLDSTMRALRGGPDAAKAAAGYIERGYADMHSLEQVEVDEWITDILFYDPKQAARVGRGYLLTFFDTRSLYPLTWVLIERSRHADSDKKRLEDAEMQLFSDLLKQYGAPGRLYSDRGRFRGAIWGGSKFIAAERTSQVAGILDRLDIGRNMPREHNPRGSRLERFHKEFANWARTLPGWVGSDTDERKQSPGDQQAAAHQLWVRGKAPRTPLLSKPELLLQVNAFVEKWRERPSGGRDMNGLAPAAVFEQCKPLGGFRQVSAGDLDWATAEHFIGEMVEKGGIIQLPDKRRYSNARLLLVEGERRECIRLRKNKTFITVMPAEKGEEIIFAEQRAVVGFNDREKLSLAIEEQTRIRKILAMAAEAMAQGPLADGRGSAAGIATPRPAAPRSADAIPARDFFDTATTEEKQVLHSAGHSVQDDSNKSWETMPEEKPVPSLYDDAEPTIEDL